MALFWWRKNNICHLFKAKTYLFLRCGEEENKGDEMALAGCGGESSEKKHLPVFSSWRRREQRRRHGSCRLWRNNEEDLPLVRSGEEENKGDDMAPAGCLGESPETKAYLFFHRGEEENKGDDMALADCGGEQRR